METTFVRVFLMGYNGSVRIYMTSVYIRMVFFGGYVISNGGFDVANSSKGFELIQPATRDANIWFDRSLIK